MDTAGAMNRLADAIGLLDCASGEAASYEEGEVLRRLGSIGHVDAQTRQLFFMEAVAGRLASTATATIGLTL